MADYGKNKEKKVKRWRWLEATKRDAMSEMGQKARQKCIENYSWDAMEKVLLKVFGKYE